MNLHIENGCDNTLTLQHMDVKEAFWVGKVYDEMTLCEWKQLFSLTSFLLLPKLFSMTMVSAAMCRYLEQGGKGRLAMAITPARTSTTLPPEYRQTSAWLRTSCSCSDKDGILHNHTDMFNWV